MSFDHSRQMTVHHTSEALRLTNFADLDASLTASTKKVESRISGLLLILSYRYPGVLIYELFTHLTDSSSNTEKQENLTSIDTRCSREIHISGPLQVFDYANKFLIITNYDTSLLRFTVKKTWLFGAIMNPLARCSRTFTRSFEHVSSEAEGADSSSLSG